MENTLGILAKSFRIFHTTIHMKLDIVVHIISVSCFTQYFERNTKNLYISRNFVNTEILDTVDIVNSDLRNGIHLDGLQNNCNHKCPNDAEEYRQTYTSYFITDGKVP